MKKLKVLVFDDQPFKVEAVMKAINEGVGTDNVEFDNALYINPGTHMLIRGNYDLCILDNSMPRFPDEASHIETDCAEGVLEWCFLKNKKTKFIICSSYAKGEKEEYFDGLCREYHEELLGYVRYDQTSIDWERKMIGLIKKNFELK
jgi:hypothetical protein